MFLAATGQYLTVLDCNVLLWTEVGCIGQYWEVLGCKWAKLCWTVLDCGRLWGTNALKYLRPHTFQGKGRRGSYF